MLDSKSKSNFHLIPTLGKFTTIGIVIGAIIGSGIFKKPAVMSSFLGSPELLIIVWVIAGVITLFGALTNSEVAGILTETGGQYVYFQKMYGEFIAYLYGWAIFAIIQTGSIASITYIFSEYTEFFIKLPRFNPDIEKEILLYIPFIGNIYPIENIGVKLLTIIAITFLSAVNYLGIKFGGEVSNAFTILKVSAIIALVFFAFIFADGSFNNFTLDSSSFSNNSTYLMGGFIAALSGAFWAYDGWNNVTYIAGEVKRPQKNIPIALTIGTLICICIYVIINFAYLYVIPVETMAKSSLVAADVATLSIGAWGGAFVSAAVMVSTFGASNGSIMVSARVYFAMSNRGMFFNTIGKVHPKFKTPGNALILQCIWAGLLVISGTFDILTDMLIFVSWVFYALGAVGVFVLRKKMPDINRPYKVIGYPYVPLIFIVFACCFIVLTVYQDVTSYINGDSQIIDSIFGLFLVALGVPLYVYFKRKNKIKSDF